MISWKSHDPHLLLGGHLPNYCISLNIIEIKKSKNKTLLRVIIDNDLSFMLTSYPYVEWRLKILALLLE